MISEALMNLWNDKSEEIIECAVRNIAFGQGNSKKNKGVLLSRLNLPTIRQRLITDKMNRNLAKRSSQRSKESNPEKTNSMLCNCLRKTSSLVEKAMEEAAIIRQKLNCNTIYQFGLIMMTTVRTFSSCIEGLEGIYQSMTYWDDPREHVNHLCIVSGMMWLLTYSVQFLPTVEGNDILRVRASKESIATPQISLQQFGNISNTYQSIATKTRSLHQSLLSLYLSVIQLRDDVDFIMNQISSQWRLDSMGVLLGHARVKGRERLGGIRKIQKIAHGNSSGDSNSHESCPRNGHDREDIFHLHWSPLTTAIGRTKGEQRGSVWTHFFNLDDESRLEHFISFIKRPLDLVECTIDDVKSVTSRWTHVHIPTDTTPSFPVVTTGGATKAMRHFASTYIRPDGPIDSTDKSRVVYLLREFGLSLDRMEETCFRILKLSEELEDSVQLCYTYLQLFYNWDLPPFDNLGEKSSRKRATDKVMHLCKEIHGRLDGSRNLTQQASIFSTFYSFSTSIYQDVMQEYPLEVDGWTIKAMKTSEMSQLARRKQGSIIPRYTLPALDQND